MADAATKGAYMAGLRKGYSLVKAALDEELKTQDRPEERGAVVLEFLLEEFLQTLEKVSKYED